MRVVPCGSMYLKSGGGDGAGAGAQASSSVMGGGGGASISWEPRCDTRGSCHPDPPLTRMSTMSFDLRASISSSVISSGAKMYCTGFGSRCAEQTSGDGLRFFFLRGSSLRRPFRPYTCFLLGLAAIGLLYWVDMAVNLLLLLRADMAACWAAFRCYSASRRLASRARGAASISALPRCCRAAGRWAFWILPRRSSRGTRGARRKLRVLRANILETTAAARRLKTRRPRPSEVHCCHSARPACPDNVSGGRPGCPSSSVEGLPIYPTA